MRSGTRTGRAHFLAAAAWALACAAPAGANPQLLVVSRDKTVNLGVPPRVSLENGVCFLEAQQLVAGNIAVPQRLLEVTANDPQLEWTAPSDGCWFITLLQLRRDEVHDGRAPRFEQVFEADARCLRFAIVIVNPAETVPAGLLDAAALAADGRFAEARRALDSLGPKPGQEFIAAIERCRWIVEWFTQRHDLDLERAVRLRSEGRLAEARDLLVQLLAASPTHAEGQSELGAVLLELDDPAAALPALEKSLDLEPRADTAFNLAIARFRLRKWNDAWAACDLCLKWSGEGSRLLERAAVLGMRIAKGLDENRQEAYREISKWAAGTEAGGEAEKKLR